MSAVQVFHQKLTAAQYPRFGPLFIPEFGGKMVNFYRKISLHMIGIGGFTGLFLGLSLNFGINLNTEMIAGILLAGIIGFARLKSNSHQPAEIYTGFLMGVLVMTVLMTLL